MTLYTLLLLCTCFRGMCCLLHNKWK